MPLEEVAVHAAPVVATVGREGLIRLLMTLIREEAAAAAASAGT